jgi:hypothetical protein
MFAQTINFCAQRGEQVNVDQLLSKIKISKEDATMNSQEVTPEMHDGSFTQENNMHTF